MYFPVLVISAGALLAQNGGTITGTVTDVYGGVLANAAVQATNVATKALYQGESSPTGTYTLAQLPAGTYDLSATVPGMARFEQKNIAVGVAHTVQLNIKVNDFSLNTVGEDRQFFEGLTTRHKTPAGPAPRMTNGKPDLSGVWLGTFLQDSGKPELTPSAQATVNERAANHLKDVPSSRCQPNGITLFGVIFTYRVVQTPGYIVIIDEHDLPARQIFLDGRSHPKNLDPTWMGHSIGHWQGDTLVVEGVGCNGRAGTEREGNPFTEKTHITDRWQIGRAHV